MLPARTTFSGARINLESQLEIYSIALSFVYLVISSAVDQNLKPIKNGIVFPATLAEQADLLILMYAHCAMNVCEEHREDSRSGANLRRRNLSAR